MELLFRGREGVGAICARSTRRSNLIHFPGKQRLPDKNMAEIQKDDLVKEIFKFFYSVINIHPGFLFLAENITAFVLYIFQRCPTYLNFMFSKESVHL